jgi:Amidase
MICTPGHVNLTSKNLNRQTKAVNKKFLNSALFVLTLKLTVKDTMINLSELTISQVHSAYTTGTVTAIELVQAYLDRIKSPDKTGPTLNFILAQSTTALREADDLDGYLRTTEGLKGGLHSIPTIIEDQIETKGSIITIFGSIVEKHHVPDEVMKMPPQSRS